MRRIFLLFFAAAWAVGLAAQSAKEEIKKNVYLSASNCVAYYGPQQKLTPAPKGMKPFYISHYGRHGSRFLINQPEYTYPYESLLRADSLGKLTELGKDVLRRVALIRQEADGRLGELTPLGAEQHRQIAKRMYERFPEVFEGAATVDAKSTVVLRCVLSMENALLQLQGLNPKLRIVSDASQHDMYYMNQNDPKIWNNKYKPDVIKVYDAYCAKHDRSAGTIARLFNDTAYINHDVNVQRLGTALFKLAANVQSTELRKQLTLYDIFTDDELYHHWMKDNARFYIGFGHCPLTGAIQPYSQRNLLRRIIHEADSCIALQKPGASLRFGHETMVLPLVCLLGVNGYDMQVSDFDQLERKGWRNYRIFPMAANLQFVFYRKSAQDKDVVFKLLLNEDEVTLPLKGSAPYYHWSDFKEHYLKKLDGYAD